jgi:hypothetical protein
VSNVKYYLESVTCDLCGKMFQKQCPNDPAYDDPMDICDDCNGGEPSEDC